MTKNIFTLLLLQLFALTLFAHAGGHGEATKTWQLKAGNEAFQANFTDLKNGVVFLAGADHAPIQYALDDFSEADQQYIKNKSSHIQVVNGAAKAGPGASIPPFRKGIIACGGLLVLFSILKLLRLRRLGSLSYGLFGGVLMLVGCQDTPASAGPSSDSMASVPANDPAALKAIFGAFADVSTRHDDQYFYIESDGLPNHQMMVGITNWQQQVPIPHPYTGENSWAIPLQPRMAAEPLSTQENFMKGAIAIAANGIPIFNPLNNRGEDANAIGELDRWGGHCGRADDYHYHLPPSHLQSTVGAEKPIAYALDGFPVFGETTLELDEYLGRFTPDSSYQYHAVKEFPYLIAGMRGEVAINPRTSAPENEISPQAKSRGVRPALRPLRGAAITDFQNPELNQYTLTYTLDDETHRIRYGWDENQRYSFEFQAPDGTTTESSYHRK